MTSCQIWNKNFSNDILHLSFSKEGRSVTPDVTPAWRVERTAQHIWLYRPFLFCIQSEKWRIKVNQNKSTHITFTIRKGQCPPIRIKQTTIPQGSTVKYLGLHLDSKLTWREHITKKRKQLDLKTREINWLIGKNSPLSLENKILIYKTVLKPIWTYGIAL